MFFLVSKLLAPLIPISNLLLVIAIVGALALLLRYRRVGGTLLSFALIGFVLCGFGPVGIVLIRPLEDRFPPPGSLPAEPAGIIVLGGGLNPRISNARNSLTLTQDGSRLTAGAALALRYPRARLVFSGGSADVLSGSDEAGPAKQFFEAMGISDDRIVIESRSRNTAENAAFTLVLVKPRPGEVWLLVTSAAHMARAVGSFRQVGFAVMPYPTSYRTPGERSDYMLILLNASGGLSLTDAAVHEWLGLLVYRLTGRTDAFFPGP